MPTYDYQCRQCGTTFEVIHSMGEDGPTTCEKCGGQLRRVLYPSGIIFKGSGFYKTDSRSSSTPRRAPAAPSAASTKDGGSTSDAKKSGDNPAGSGGSDAGSAPKSAD